MNAIPTELELLSNQEALRIDEATRFLSKVFGARQTDERIGIFTLPNRWFTSFSTAEEAAEYAIKSRDFNDAYVQVGVSNKMKGGRWGTDDITGICAMWADVDFGTDGHGKETYPPSINDALALVREMGLEPSFTVHSGHGLHVYWLLDERLNATDARPLAQAWLGALKGYAAQHGWNVDSTHDLARVLRVPGTSNRKTPNTVLPVHLISDTDARYDLETIRSAIARAPQVAKQDTASEILPINITPLTVSDDELLELARDAANGTKFRALWEGKIDRYDSASEADQALCRILAFWTQRDAERMERLWCNSPAGQRDKTQRRADYRLRTIKNAIKNQADVYTPNALEDDSEDTDNVEAQIPVISSIAALESTQNYSTQVGVDGNEDGEDGAENEITPERARERIHKSIGLDIVRVLKYGESDPTYRLDIKDARGRVVELQVPNVGHLLSYSKMRESLYVAGLPYVRFTAKRWTTITTRYLRALEELIETASPADELEDAVFRFIDHHSIGTPNNVNLKSDPKDTLAHSFRVMAAANAGRTPFDRMREATLIDEEGYVYFALPVFCWWLDLAEHNKLATKTIAARLREGGRFVEGRTPGSWPDKRTRWWRTGKPQPHLRIPDAGWGNE